MVLPKRTKLMQQREEQRRQEAIEQAKNEQQRFSNIEFKVLVFCALKTEYDATEKCLDEFIKNEEKARLQETGHPNPMPRADWGMQTMTQEGFLGRRFGKTPFADTGYFSEGSYKARNGLDVKIRLYSPDKMGTSSITGASIVIEEFAPDFVLMCGICAGRKKEIKLRDVIASDSTFLYEVGKKTPEGPKSSSVSTHVPMQKDLVKIAKEVSLDCASYRVKVGQYACGDNVVADEKIWEEIDTVGGRDTVALDMESGYIGETCSIAQIPYMVVKSCCDYGDSSTKATESSKEASEAKIARVDALKNSADFASKLINKVATTDTALDNLFRIVPN